MGLSALSGRGSVSRGMGGRAECRVRCVGSPYRGASVPRGSLPAVAETPVVNPFDEPFETEEVVLDRSPPQSRIAAAVETMPNEGFRKDPPSERARVVAAAPEAAAPVAAAAPQECGATVLARVRQRVSNAFFAEDT